MSTEAPVSTGAVLYVDDDQVGRMVFEKSFADDFDLHVVEDGQAALEHLERNPVAVVVTDQRMPGMSGNELLEIVKTRFPHVVRCVLTAHGDLDVILKAVNDGLVARYLVKPWDREELADILRWALEVHAKHERDPALRARLLNVERLATLGGLLAGVLHDVGGPVSYLSGNTERLTQFAPALASLGQLVDDHGDEIPADHRLLLRAMLEEYNEIVSDMGDGCEHLIEVIQGLRPLVRHDAPAGQGRADADKAVRYAVSVARHRARELLGEGAVEVQLDAPRLPMVATAFPALVQVLTNLLDNAIEAIQRGRGKGTVHMRAVVEPREVRVEIRDDGVGIPKAFVAKVTDPFFTTREAGTGLGLAQVRRLVETAGGALRIESVEGEGTTISFTFARV